MSENSNSQNIRLRIRVSKYSLSFAVVDHASINKVAFEPYTVRSGVAMAAILREALRDSSLLNRGYQRVEVCIDAPIMLIPIQEFDKETAETLYKHTFRDCKADVVLHNVLPGIKAVAVFSVNKDLRLVVEDNFADVRYSHVAQPMWNHLYTRSFTGMQRKLYAYFHDRSVEVFAFDKNRFRFQNTFDADYARDAIYYIMYVWKLLAMDNNADELHVCGNCKDTDFLASTLRKYLKRVYVFNASAEFNGSPITHIKGMSLDMQVLFIKGK